LSRLSSPRLTGHIPQLWRLCFSCPAFSLLPSSGSAWNFGPKTKSAQLHDFGG
jgi:hypothetical protein